MMIESLQNDFVKHLVKLKQKKYRDLHQEYLVEGEHLIEELKKTNLKYQIIATDGECDVKISDKIAKKISASVSGSNIFALVENKEDPIKFGKRHILVDGVQDPGNLGTMIRTAYSFGFDAIYISQTSADHLSQKTLRSSQGAVFHIPIIRCELNEIIPKMKKEGIKVYATNLSDSARSIETVKDDALAIVMGSEGQGVSKEILAIADEDVVIPSNNFDSLNVAVAQGIICYLLKK